LTPARILVVEDDFVVARDIRQKLIRIGYSVVGSTARGEEALILAKEARPDLVLMDIRLEGAIDGIEAAEQIRESCRVPVVFLTAYADDETVKRASQTEPFGYLIKPFEDFQLRTVIEVALYKHAADRKVRDSERRFVATLSSIGDAVIATDDQALVTFMNSVAETLTGWTLATAVGRPLSEVFRILNETTRKVVEDPAAKVLRLGATVGLANHTVLLSRDGHEIPIDDSGSPIIDDDNRVTGTVLVFRDITERRQVEAELRKAQEDLARVARLTTIGELTVSIAHEVSQPLMAIVTDAAACQSWLSNDRLNVDEARRAAERIEKHGHRAGDVVKSVRALTRKTTVTMAPLDINSVITETIDLLRSELRQKEISLETDLSSIRGSVSGDRVQLQQVILNLIKNGIEAMEGSVQQPRLLRVTSQSDDASHLQITIADNGIGFDSANADDMFDAFFTTKPQGIGLGLSICRSIVDAHGGRLWALQNSPQGSIFCFVIPMTEDDAEAAPDDGA
jgi:PAS domain S-box-containing protein